MPSLGDRHCPLARRRALRAGILALLLLALVGAGAASAQSAVGDPVDLRFVVRDATSGQPAVAERLTVAYVMGRLNTIVDMTPGGAEFLAPAVPVKEVGQYIIAVWYQGVPYWWQKRGSDLVAGPVTLDVFGISEDLQAVSITGLNLVVRNQETTAEFELMFEIVNETRPQVVVNRASGTFTVQLPAGATGLEATYLRGPEPTPVPVTLSGTSASVAMPLTPGTNRLRLTGRAPWDGRLELPVGSDLPIAAWSLLTAPASVTSESSELQAPDEQAVPGFVRRTGPALAARQVVTVLLNAGTPAGAAEPLFAAADTANAPAAAAPAPEAGTKGGLALPLAALLALIIIGALVFLRRGRS